MNQQGIVHAGKVIAVLVFLCLGSVTSLRAQETFSEITERQPQNVPANLELVDTILSINARRTQSEFKPEPDQALWLGAVIPGYGQILNRKYWKLPIVYAGFLGCYFAIDWNSNRYTNFRNAFLDITDNDDNTNSYLLLIPEGFTIQSYGGVSGFTGILRSGMDRARYNRDLSVIVSIAFYGLTLIDAFVDAHLFDFDISPDLSLNLRPHILRDNGNVNRNNNFAYGVGARLKF